MKVPDVLDPEIVYEFTMLPGYPVVTEEGLMAMRRMHAPKGSKTPKSIRKHAGRKSPKSAVVKPEDIRGKEPFKKHVKKLEPDDRPRPDHRAKHMAAQGAKAKSRRALMKKLGHTAI